MGENETQKIFLMVSLFFITILSYNPLKTEINYIATCSTLTNPIYTFLDSWFGLFWAILAIFFLVIALIQASKS